MAKQPFAWDTEELVKEIVEEKKKFEVKKCTKDGNTFVVVVSWYMSREGWKFKSNATFPKYIWDQIADAIVGSDIW
ncbi:hypothetical protein [Bacillus phage vB_BtM_BMBsp2]|nr:hypothetical protein [Bacillus phage vB_BtM_BMBsp2]